MQSDIRSAWLAQPQDCEIQPILLVTLGGEYAFFSQATYKLFFVVSVEGVDGICRDVDTCCVEKRRITMTARTYKTTA
jgi:hypothetical protein